MSTIASQTQANFAPPQSLYEEHFQRIHKLLMTVKVTTAQAVPLSIVDGTEQAISAIEALRNTTNKVILVGNGGSAGICSHQAIDMSKNAGIRAIALNDPAQLTCLANDFGYEFVFSKAIEMFALPGDILIAISSSGRSANIVNAARSAKNMNCQVFTYGGFKHDAPLMSCGDLNFFVESDEYGPVEVVHLALIHYLTDMLCARRVK